MRDVGNIESDSCPRCGGARGAAQVTIQTWEHTGVTLTNKDRYTVRTAQAPGLCGACAGALERQRFVADVLCLAPLVALFLALVFSESKLALGALLVYLIYLARHLDYNWADGAVYGNELLGKLAGFVPDGDPGQTYLPVSWTHMGVRIAAIPAALVTLLTVGGALLPVLAAKSADGKAASASPRPQRSYAADRVLHAKQVLSESDLAMPVEGSRPAFYTQQMGGKAVRVLRVWADPAAVPADKPTAMRTGRQLADDFLTENADSMLVIEGAGGTAALYRFEVERMRSALPR